MTSPVHPPAPNVPLSPPSASADDLSVFDLTTILHAQWFLDRSHLASNVVSAQHGPTSDFDWVEFAPPFHTHLLKCATALLPPQLCSMKQLKGVLFAYMLEVLNLPVSTLAQFKRKTLSKKVCPRLDPTFKPPPPAGQGATIPILAVRGRPSPMVPSPAPPSPVLAVSSIAMAYDTPPSSSPTLLPCAQGSASPASSTPRVLDEAALLAYHMAGLAPPSHLILQAPPKHPASPLSPPQRPAPHACGSPGLSPSPATSSHPSCSCCTSEWASCWVCLTWNSSPLRAHPHALPSTSPPFIFSTTLPPTLKEQISVCSDCLWDPPDAPDHCLYLCHIHFLVFASDPCPLLPGASWLPSPTPGPVCSLHNIPWPYALTLLLSSLFYTSYHPPSV